MLVISGKNRPMVGLAILCDDLLNIGAIIMDKNSHANKWLVLAGREVIVLIFIAACFWLTRIDHHEAATGYQPTTMALITAFTGIPPEELWHVFGWAGMVLMGFIGVRLITRMR